MSKMNDHQTGKQCNDDDGGGKENWLEKFWNEQIMERFIKANLFIVCCIAAGLLLIVYLGAFSCEVSWILEAHGQLPMSAYILCTQYFVVFVATTILIHGLVTGLPWGLFAWSIVIGLLSIPELIFVMIMTTQHWGLQSLHGIIELTSYLVRLLINSFALICVIPTGIRWRRETQVLNQLQDLATRLQLQTPPPSAPMTKLDSRRSSKRFPNSVYDNAAYQLCESVMKPQGVNLYNNNNLSKLMIGSQNEFNASIFTSPFVPVAYGGGDTTDNVPNGNRTQSLMDLRCTLPGMYNPRYVLEMEDKNVKYFNITFDDLRNNIQESRKSPASIVGSVNDPIYCSIDATNEQQQQQQQQQQQHKQQSQQPKLSRNCVSLENLDGITRATNELSIYGHNLLQNYERQQYLAMMGYMSPAHCNAYRRQGVPHPLQQLMPPMRRSSSQLQHYHPGIVAGYSAGYNYGNFTNPYIATNSKLSLGNESDDYRKYRDVAL